VPDAGPSVIITRTSRDKDDFMESSSARSVDDESIERTDNEIGTSEGAANVDVPFEEDNMRDGVSHKSIETIVIDDDDVQLRDLDSLENSGNEVNADSFIKMSSKVVEEDSKRTSDDSVTVFIDNDDISTSNDSISDHDTVRYNTSETSPKDVLSDPSGISIHSLEDGNKLPPQNSSPSYVALPPATIEDSQKETVGKVAFGSDATASRTVVDDVVQGDSDYQRSQKQKYETLTNTDESHTSADDFHVDNSELPEVDTLSSQDGQSIEADVTDFSNDESHTSAEVFHVANS